MHVALGLVGLLLLARAAFFVFHERTLTPETVTCLAWGLVLSLGALEIIRYSEITIKGVVVIVSFLVLLAVTFLITKSAQPMTGNWPSADPSPLLIRVTRFVSFLVIGGMLLRYIHVVVIYNRPLFDVQKAYELTVSEAMPGTWYSRFAIVLFLWPLPASVLAWHAVRLRWKDRMLFFVASLGHALFGYLQGGRSGLLLTITFLVPLTCLSLVRGPAARATKQQKVAFTATITAFAIVAAAILLVMFGLRTGNTITGGSYARFMDVNPAYAEFVNPYGGSLIQDGILGAVGYGTQPAQRLSLFFELDVKERFYGAWNLDLFGNILRRIGIGTDQYLVALNSVTSVYTEQGVPTGTFSTCIRDFYLDFGWIGVFFGGVGMVFGAQFFYLKVIGGQREDLLPLLGFFFALLGISPLFSGLQVGGANLSLCGALISCLILKQVGKSPGYAGPKSSILGRAPSGRPAPRRMPR
jgi:hypothetical protein